MRFSIKQLEPSDRAALVKLPDDDVGHSDRLAILAKSCLRFCVGQGWLSWGGQKWSRCDDALIYQIVEQLPSLVRAAARSESEQDNERIFNATKKLRARSRIESIVKLAERKPSIRVAAEEFDRDPNLLNLRNGTLDVTSFKFRKHLRSDLITRLAPVEFDAKAKCPKWEAFLNDIFQHDAELIRFVQKAVGYSLTGDVSEQCLFMLHGAGANGKSVFLNTLRTLAGDYGCTSTANTFTRQRNSGIRNDVARLAGARLVVASEFNEGEALDEAFVKQVTGADPVTARYLYRETFEFVPQFKLWIATNSLPRIDGHGHAIRRRLRVIPFGKQVAPNKQNPYLEEELRSELSGILNWAIEGARLWRDKTMGRLERVPLAVSKAVNRYCAEERAIVDFLREVMEGRDRIGASELYESYRSVVARPMGQSDFSHYLLEKGFDRRRSGPDGGVEYHPRTEGNPSDN